MKPNCHCPPLPLLDRTFRILSLEPGHGDAIICELHVASLPDSPAGDTDCTYTALSYAWGDDESSREIQVGAWPVLVRENLWQLLKHPRHETNPVNLWIDYLCIDQSDPTERAIQVQLMDKIYKGARQVIVWLGLAGSQDRLAMDTIAQSVRGSSLDPLSDTPGASAALIYWSSRSYWHRAWVEQEFVLGPNMVVQCGSARLDWTALNSFLTFVELSRRHERFTHTLGRFSRTPAYALMQQKANYATAPMPLVQLLVRNQSTICKDSLDKIYSLLGLADDSVHKPLIRVSYSKNPLHACEVDDV